MKRGYAYILMFAAAVALLAVFATGWNVELPNIPQPVEGDEEPITLTTKVVVVNPWFAEPYIKSVETELGGEVAQQFEVSIFPYEAIVTLKVISPDGKVVKVGSKRVLIDLGAETDVTFVWQTKARGTHRIIATLYDKFGNIVDEDTTTYYVAG